MGSRNFASQSPNHSQYLVNGVSDQKSVRNKRDEEFIFLWFIKIRFNVSSTIIVILQFQKNELKNKKKAQYLKNGGFYQKSSWNKKDLKSNFHVDRVIKFSVSSANIAWERIFRQTGGHLKFDLTAGQGAGKICPLEKWKLYIHTNQHAKAQRVFIFLTNMSYFDTIAVAYIL